MVPGDDAEPGSTHRVTSQPTLGIAVEVGDFTEGPPTSKGQPHPV